MIIKQAMNEFYVKKQLLKIKEVSSLQSNQKIEIYETTYDPELDHNFQVPHLPACTSSILAPLLVFTDLYQNKSDRKMILYSLI